MALTDTEIDKIYKYLGYPMKGSNYSLWLYEISHTNINYAISKLTTQGETDVRAILTTMDKIEANLIQATDFFVVNKVGSININSSNAKLLWGEYYQWAKKLSMILEVPYNPAIENLAGDSVSVEVLH